MFETVGRGLLLTICGLFSFLTEQQDLVVQEEVPLHGFKPGQVLHLQSDHYLSHFVRLLVRPSLHLKNIQM